MRWLSRSVASSIVSSSSRVALGREVDVASAAGCVTDALIDDSGVRRSWDTAASSAVRSSLASARPSARSASARQLPLLHRDRDLTGERLEHLAVVVAERLARQHQHLGAVQRDDDVGVVRVAPAASRRRTRARSSCRRRLLAQHGDVRGVERPSGAG